MTHLSEQVLVDLAEEGADGAAARSGRDHLARCARCRDRVETLRETMQTLREDQAPEPSPLFWDQLSRRVLAGLDRQPVAPARGWWLPRWRWAFAMAAGAVLVAVLTRPGLPPARSGAGAQLPTPATDMALDGPGVTRPATDGSWAVAEEDESWGMLVGLAESLEGDAAFDAGLFVRPGSIEQAVLMLSEDERRDLARAIRAELDRSAL